MAGADLLPLQCCLDIYAGRRLNVPFLSHNSEPWTCPGNARPSSVQCPFASNDSNFEAHGWRYTRELYCLHLAATGASAGYGAPFSMHTCSKPSAALCPPRLHAAPFRWRSSAKHAESPAAEELLHRSAACGHAPSSGPTQTDPADAQPHSRADPASPRGQSKAGPVHAPVPRGA